MYDEAVESDARQGRFSRASTDRSAGPSSGHEDGYSLDHRRLVQAASRGHVLQLQRQAGNRAVTRSIVQRGSAAPTATVQRDDGDDDWARMAELVMDRTPPARPDMAPEDWTRQLGVDPPRPLSTVELLVPASPPRTPAQVEAPGPPSYVPPERCQPGHHQSPERVTFDDSVFVSLDRMRAWESFQATASLLTLNWNSAVPLVNAFDDAQRDASLQSDEMGLQALGPGFSGDVGGMVESQTVPPATGSSTTVGSLFDNGANGGSPAGGTGLARPPGASSIERLANDPAVREVRAEALALDRRITGQIARISGRAAGVTRAVAELEGANARAQLLSAREQESDARADLGELEEAKKQAGENAKKVTGLLSDVATAGSPAAAGAAVVEFAVEETLELVASQLIDARYADQIARATRRLTEASARVRRLAQAEVQAQIRAATAALAEATRHFEAARADLGALLISRRNAYERLGREVGSSSAAAPGARRRTQAIVTAIPLVETVVGRANNIVTTIGNVPYSRESGVGVAMARAAGWPIADQFVSCVTSYDGLRVDFEQRQRFWQARLASLRDVMTRLSGLHTR